VKELDVVVTSVSVKCVCQRCLLWSDICVVNQWSKALYTVSQKSSTPNSWR